MYKLINEGSAKIFVPTEKKISKKLRVFYNPIMSLNRDISILLLNSIDKADLQIADPLAASGIRSIRFLKELRKNKIKMIYINDHDKNFKKTIKNNFKLNKLKISNKIIISSEDANLFLLNSKGFDYIDIDPFGTPNPFLDSAIKRISRDGILAVTSTDTAALTGTYPKATLRKYWAASKKDAMMHETGLRILIRKIQLIGAQYDKALIPVFSYFRDHYFRIFFKTIKGKKEVDKIMKLHGFFNDSGPLWLGTLFDKKLANKMHKLSLKNKIPNNELTKFLKIIKDESKIDSIGFYDVHRIVKKEKIRKMMKKPELIRKIKKNNFKASETHFSGTGIRSDIPYNRLIKLLKE
jgi:tRNA (guanine26-N2/guanine27-N2)-dimethyltransferase